MSAAHRREVLAGLWRLAGLACLGYPFHPPGQPAKLRTAHLENLATPALIIQGTRDPFGSREEVPRYRISPTIHIEWLQGQHSLSGPQLSALIHLVVQFVTSIT